jgi:hypothetical protein
MPERLHELLEIVKKIIFMGAKIFVYIRAGM